LKTLRKLTKKLLAHKLSFLVVFCAFFLAGVLLINALTIIMRGFYFPGFVILKALGIGIYWNSNCTSQVTTLEWGEITLPYNWTKNVTVYLRNEGNIPVFLSLNTTNWRSQNKNVNMSDYLTVSWNYTGQTINPYEVIKVTLTLTVSKEMVKAPLFIMGKEGFSFDIIITAKET